MTPHPPELPTDRNRWYYSRLLGGAALVLISTTTFALYLYNPDLFRREKVQTINIPIADLPAQAEETPLDAPDDDPIRHWQEQAVRGDAEAQYRLGLEYLNAPYPVQRRAGLTWLREAAAQHHLPAEETLMNYLWDKNRAEAERWLQQAAEEGSHDAQTALAESLTPPDPADKTTDKQP